MRARFIHVNCSSVFNFVDFHSNARFCMFVPHRAIKSIEKSVEQFNSIQDHLKNALFLKQQLRFEQMRRKQQQQVRLESVTVIDVNN